MKVNSHCSVVVKPTHVVTSIKQSPVLKCHFFFYPVIERTKNHKLTKKDENDQICINLKCRTAINVLFLYFNLCLSVKLDSLSCSLKSISFLTI
jgi:hypothetical protein